MGHSNTEFHADAAVIATSSMCLLAGKSLYNYKARFCGRTARS